MAPGQSTKGAAASAVCDQHGKHHQCAAAGNKTPNRLLEERLNARVTMEVGTSLLITGRVGCPEKWSRQDSSSIFVLYNQTFPSLPRNLPVSSMSLRGNKNTLEKSHGCNNHTYVKQQKRARDVLLTQKQTPAPWLAWTTLAAWLGISCSAAGQVSSSEQSWQGATAQDCTLLFSTTDRNETRTPAPGCNIYMKSVCI